jgi:hypothetical protein
MNRFVRLIVISAVTAGCVGIVFAQGGQGGQGRRGGGGFGQGQFGMRAMGGQFGNEFSILSRKDVQADLVLTADQKTKLDAYLEKQRGNRGQGVQGQGQRGNRGQGGQGGQGQGQRGNRGQGGQGGQNFDMEAFRKQQAERQEAQKKEVATILTEDQMKRLHQIWVQLQGNRILLNKDVQKELGFTADQTKKVDDLTNQLGDATRSLMEKMRNQEISREDMMASMEKNTKALDAALIGILTKEQTAKLDAMKGKAFKADPNENGRRGG